MRWWELDEKEAKALAAWAEHHTTAWGPKFDAALAVAQRLSNAFKAKQKKPTGRRGQPPNPTWRK